MSLYSGCWERTHYCLIKNVGIQDSRPSQLKEPACAISCLHSWAKKTQERPCTIAEPQTMWRIISCCIDFPFNPAKCPTCFDSTDRKFCLRIPCCDSSVLYILEKQVLNEQHFWRWSAEWHTLKTCRIYLRKETSLAKALCHVIGKCNILISKIL